MNRRGLCITVAAFCFLLASTRLTVEAQGPTVPVGLLTEALLPGNRCQSNPPGGGQAGLGTGRPTLQGIHEGQGSSAPSCLEPLSPLEQGLLDAARRLHRVLVFKTAT